MDNKASGYALEFVDATVGYSQRILFSDLNLGIEQAKLVALIGRNGSGKSTLLKSIANFLPLLKGELHIAGKLSCEITPLELARLVSVVLTKNYGFEQMKVREIVENGRYPYTSWHGALSQTDRAIVASAMENMGIEQLSEKSFAEISDGERQKTLIARCIAQDTPLMLLDEPTGHLDVVNRIELMEILTRLVKFNQKTVVISTHEIELAMQYADRIILADEGKIITGTPQDFKSNDVLSKVFYKKVTI